MNDFYEKAGAAALNRIFGFKPVISLKLVENLGSAAAVFSLGRKELEDIFGPYSQYPPLLCPERIEEAVRELERLREEGCDFIPITDKDYPKALKECDDPPVGLYIRSASPAGEIFNSRPLVSVVGTRDISPYGSEWCSRIVCRLSQCNPQPCVVSGLALGTDITAHISALDSGIPTVAVLPTGIDSIYPSSHRHIGRRIAGTPSCALVTDYPPGTQAQKINFLRRNRIIAGMSRATVLVESRIRGGGLMTARLASGYGRDVLVLPGRIEDPRSQGCNQLAKEKIAEPISDLESLPAALGLEQGEALRRKDFGESVAEAYASERDCGILAAVARCIASERGITAEEICRKVQLPYPDVAALVSRLENDGLIRTDLLQRCFIVSKFA